MGDVLRVFDRIGGVGRAVVAGVGVATIAAVAYLVMSAGPSAYVPAFTNLSTHSAAQVQSTLAGAHIPTKLSNGGATVSVPSSQVDAARVAIGNADISVNGQQSGLESLTGMGMGATDWQQNIAYQRAMQGQLANEIMQVACVQDATVNLAMPHQSLFLQDQQQPTASVLLDTGCQLPDDSVRAVQRLVSGAVTGLTSSNVVVTDQSGQLLSQTGGGISDATASRLSTEASYSRRMEANAQALLDSMLGPGQAVVMVNAKLNTDDITQKSVTYGKTGKPLQTSSETEKLKETGSSGAGVAGTASNTPGYAAGTGATNKNYTHTKGDQVTGYDQTVTDLTKATGDVTQLNVSLAFAAPAGSKAGATAPPLNATQKAAVSAVKSYLGVTQQDVSAGRFTAAVSSTPFPNSSTNFLPAAAKAGGSGGPIAMATGYLKPALAAIGLIVLLFIVRRSLARRQALLGSAEARWMPALSAPPIPVDDIVLPNGPSPAEIEAAGKKALQARVEEIATTRPGDVAAQLRGWLAEES